MCMYVYIYVYAVDSGQPQVSLFRDHSCWFLRGDLIGSDFTKQFDRPVSKGIRLSLSPQYKCRPTCLAFAIGSEVGTQVLIFASQTLY